ncbi:MAG TPA: hypothetical protein VF481_04455 [Novosphingobium sp.]
MSYHFTPSGDEPWGICCKNCRLPIFPDQESQEVRFPDDSESATMSGTYHVECARPFAGLARALNLLSRPFF